MDAEYRISYAGSIVKYIEATRFITHPTKAGGYFSSHVLMCRHTATFYGGLLIFSCPIKSLDGKAFSEDACMTLKHHRFLKGKLSHCWEEPWNGMHALHFVFIAICSFPKECFAKTYESPKVGTAVVSTFTILQNIHMWMLENFLVLLTAGYSRCETEVVHITVNHGISYCKSRYLE